MQKPRRRSPPASTSALVKPRVSDIVRDRNTAAIGSFATRTAMLWRWASPSLKPTRASGGGEDILRQCSTDTAVGDPPVGLGERTRESSQETAGDCGGPAGLPY